MPQKQAKQKLLLDDQVVKQFISDFQKAAEKEPKLLKCLSFENMKHAVKFVLLESTLIYRSNYCYCYYWINITFIIQYYYIIIIITISFYYYYHYYYYSYYYYYYQVIITDYNYYYYYYFIIIVIIVIKLSVITFFRYPCHCIFAPLDCLFTISLFTSVAAGKIACLAMWLPLYLFNIIIRCYSVSLICFHLFNFGCVFE